MPLLSDKDILQRVVSPPPGARALLLNSDNQLIVHCGCEVRLGKAVSPDTGKVLCAKDLKKQVFNLEPSQMVILITEEIINMPDDLCATYAQLNRLANTGLMLLNTSIVEPGYSGPLSCVLVNFSSQRRALSVGDSIAKLTFNTITQPPAKLYDVSFNHEQYAKLISKNAASLPLSLLDVSGVEDRVRKNVGSEVRKSVTFAGIFIAVLLLWSQMEGIISNWLYTKTGYMPSTKLTEQELDIKLQQQKMDYEKQIQNLTVQINDSSKRSDKSNENKSSDGHPLKH